MNKELMTDKEIARAEMHTAIVERFQQLRKQNPEAKPFRIYRVMTREFPYSTMGIYKILQKHGIFC